MGILYEDAVLIKEAEREGDDTVITVNCPDKTGLGCDLCRVILLFGLSIARGGIIFHIFLPLFFLSLEKYLLRFGIWIWVSPKEELPVHVIFHYFPSSFFFFFFFFWVSVLVGWGFRSRRRWWSSPFFFLTSLCLQYPWNW